MNHSSDFVEVRNAERLYHPGAHKTHDRPSIPDYNQYMVRDIAEFTREALTLPADARAELAGSLLDSLDTERDANVEAVWLDEVQRRSAELDSGAVSAVQWREVEAQMETILRRDG